MPKSALLTDGQYRAVVAHMSFWKHGLDEAMKDIGVWAVREIVIDELFKAGWDYDKETDTIKFTGNDDANEG